MRCAKMVLLFAFGIPLLGVAFAVSFLVPALAAISLAMTLGSTNDFATSTGLVFGCIGVSGALGALICWSAR